MSTDRKRKATDEPGVRYREDPERRYKRRPDRYLFIRYQDAQGKTREEGIGWISQNWTVAEAAELRARIVKNIKLGSGPQTLAELRAAEQAERDQLARKNLTGEQGITFGQFVQDHYLPWAKREKKSWRDDEIILDNHVLPLLRSKPLNQITTGHIQVLKQAAIGTGMEPGSVIAVLSITRRVFNIAADTLVDPDQPGIYFFEGRNPTRGVKRPKNQDNVRINFFTYEQAREVLDGLLHGLPGRNIPAEPLIHDIALFAFHTGLRRGAICNLLKNHIKLELGHITVPAKLMKAGRRHLAYINEAIRPLLERRLAEENGPYLFADQAGHPTPLDRVTKKFTAVVNALGMNEGIQDENEKLVFHCTRHSFISWLVMGGADLYVVMKRAAHSTIQQTEKYAHLAPNRERAVVDTLAREWERRAPRPAADAAA